MASARRSQPLLWLEGGRSRILRNLEFWGGTFINHLLEQEWSKVYKWNKKGCCNRAFSSKQWKSLENPQHSHSPFLLCQMVRGFERMPLVSEQQKKDTKKKNACMCKHTLLLTLEQKAKMRHTRRPAGRWPGKEKGKPWKYCSYLTTPLLSELPGTKRSTTREEDSFSFLFNVLTQRSRLLQLRFWSSPPRAQWLAELTGEVALSLWPGPCRAPRDEKHEPHPL